MWQNATVGVVVVAAAVYCIWYVLPLHLRQRLGRRHPALGPAKPCSSCSSCGGCAAGQQPIKFYPKP